METINRRFDNVCFKHKKNVQLANRVVKFTLWEEKFLSISLDGRVCGYEIETNDVLYFLPLEALSKINKDLKEEFLADIREKWFKIGFQIDEEAELPEGVCEHVAFPSLFFRLKRFE